MSQRRKKETKQGSSDKVKQLIVGSDKRRERGAFVERCLPGT